MKDVFFKPSPHKKFLSLHTVMNNQYCSLYISESRLTMPMSASRFLVNQAKLLGKLVGRSSGDTH